jgi:hypothetical protein
VKCPEGWRIDRSHIHRALAHMFSTYDVQFLYADPWQWQSELEEWDARWPGRVVEWPANSIQRMAAGVDRFRGLRYARESFITMATLTCVTS